MRRMHLGWPCRLRQRTAQIAAIKIGMRGPINGYRSFEMRGLRLVIQMRLLFPKEHGPDLIPVPIPRDRGRLKARRSPSDRAPPHIGDLHPRELDGPPASAHGFHARETVAQQCGQHGLSPNGRRITSRAIAFCANRRIDFRWKADFNRPQNATCTTARRALSFGLMRFWLFVVVHSAETSARSRTEGFNRNR
jgi:hypothetical protein